MDKSMDFLRYIPGNIRSIINKMSKNDLLKLNEITLTNGQPLLVRVNGEKFFLGEGGTTYSPEMAYYIDTEHIKRIFELITKSSAYAYRRFIKEGFITIEGGHRIGIVGNYIYDINNNSNICDINSFCFRINNDVNNNANIITSDLYSNGVIKNTLIISPPGCGKTTLLRALAREITKNSKKKIMRCTIVDERYEIAACTEGRANYDIGNSTSVISGCKKNIAIPMIVRSMTPDVILTDEVATIEDIQAIKYAKASGCSIIATAHGIDEDNCILPKNETLQIFKKILILSSRNGPGTIERYIGDG